MKTKIYVLPSTHWDREWVLPFEKFRYKLVRMMDRLLDILEKNPAYKCFHMDGQTILIDDYLQIRPENRERVAALLRSGRIMIGPFRDMLDCLIPSGEAITRNLQIGLSDCRRWGAEPHPCGYTCDVFGHSAQMPQIYRSFGIDNCLLFRGREGYEDNKFLWEGADGSRVLVHKAYPDYTYADFFLVARWPQQEKPEPDLARMAADVQKHLDGIKPYIRGNCHFMIDGADNLEPDERLPEYLAYLNKNLPDYEFILSDLSDYNAECKKSEKEYKREKGMLYRSAREGMSSFVMKNVLSSMVQLKQENMACENLLAYAAEPLDLFTEQMEGALPQDSGYYAPHPRAGFLDYAWSKLVTNQPHDSLGGTCCTATHLDNENDYKRARENVEAVLADTLAQIARNVGAEGKGKDGAFLVYNPSQCDRNEVSVVDFKVRKGTHYSEFNFYDAAGNLLPHTMLSSYTVTEQVAEFKQLADYCDYDHFQMAIPLHIPAFSYQTITYDIPKTERNMENKEWKCSRMDPVRRDYSTMRCGVHTFQNGKLLVDFLANGSLCVTDLETGKRYEELFLFEETSECGEGWNHREVRYNQTFDTHAGNAQICILTDNEHIARVRVRHVLSVPDRAEGELRRGGDTREFVLQADYTITKNSKRIDCRVETVNNVCDHRVRVVFPTCLNASVFHTAMPYDMQEWQIARGDHTYDLEPYSPVVPGHGCLVMDDGRDTFSVYSKGLYEFEVSDRGDRAVFLTLFRAIPKETFMLKSDMGELQRKMSFEFAIDLERRTPVQALLCSKAFQTGLFTAPVTGISAALPGGEELVSIAGGAVFSSLRAHGLLSRKPELRLYDAADGCTGEVRFFKPLKGATKVRMDGTVIEKAKIAEGKLVYTLRPREIGTWALEF